MCFLFACLALKQAISTVTATKHNPISMNKCRNSPMNSPNKSQAIKLEMVKIQVIVKLSKKKKFANKTSLVNFNFCMIIGCVCFIFSNLNATVIAYTINTSGMAPKYMIPTEVYMNHKKVAFANIVANSVKIITPHRTEP